MVARLESELDHARVQLNGMEKIFDAMPSRRRSPAQPSAGRKDETGQQPTSGGRQPGAISQRWRKVLQVLHKEGQVFDANRVVEVVRHLEGRVMKPSEAKRLLEGYVEHGYVKKQGWTSFLVTDEAANRFAFADLDEMLQPHGGSVDLVAAPAPPAPPAPPPPVAQANPLDLPSVPPAPPPAPNALAQVPPPPPPSIPPPPSVPNALDALGSRAAVAAPAAPGTQQFYGGGTPQ